MYTEVFYIMCSSPFQIPNPNYGLNPDVGENYRKDRKSKYINIPCGHCPECVLMRQHNFVQRVLMESLENHLFFCTLTYNNASLPVCTTSDGYDIRFADTSDVSKMMKRLRSSEAFGRPFRFVAVSELGGERGRPHFHILFFVPKYPADDFLTCMNLEHLMFRSVLFEWRRNYGSRRSPDYRPCCTYIRKFVRGKLNTTFDLHYVNPNLSDGSQADVGYYVSKYMVKPSDRVRKLRSALKLNLPDDEFRSVWRLVAPKWFASDMFGLNATVSYVDGVRVLSPSDKCIEYARHCVDVSRDSFDAPQFIDPLSGKSYPLSRYYMNRLDVMSVDDWKFFWSKQVSSGDRRSDNMFIDKRSRSSLLTFDSNFRDKMSRLTFENDVFDDLLF